MITSPLEIQQISPDESSDWFIEYLPKPNWFKRKFQPHFDKIRELTDGIIFLATSREQRDIRVVGSIYVEPHPQHLSNGKKVPIFGWLFADEEFIYDFLLEAAEDFVKAQGFHMLRGPINEPHSFGGWGVIHQDSNLPTMIEVPPFQPMIKEYLERANYQISTTYVSLEVTTRADYECKIDMDHLNFISPTVDDLNTFPALKEEIQALARRNFTHLLPDFNPEKFNNILDIYSQVDHGEEFYLFLQDKTTGKVIAGIVEIPNIFELWQNQPITISTINAMLVDKEYRHQKLIYVVYSELKNRIRARGIKQEIGVTVWKKNLPAMTVFLKSSRKVGELYVYEKKL